MRPEDDILYFRYDTQEPIEDFLYHLQREHLRVGKVIGNKVRGRTTRRYEIKRIEDGFITRVYVKPVTITLLDLLLLLVIAVLAFMVFDALSPLFLPAP